MINLDILICDWYQKVFFLPRMGLYSNVNIKLIKKNICGINELGKELRRDHVVSSLSEVIKTTNIHATYKLMFAASQGKYQIMSSRWKPWTENTNLKKKKYKSTN